MRGILRKRRRRERSSSISRRHDHHATGGDSPAASVGLQSLPSSTSAAKETGSTAFEPPTSSTLRRTAAIWLEVVVYVESGKFHSHNIIVCIRRGGKRVSGIAPIPGNVERIHRGFVGYLKMVELCRVPQLRVVRLDFHPQLPVAGGGQEMEFLVSHPVVLGKVSETIAIFCPRTVEGDVTAKTHSLNNYPRMNRLNWEIPSDDCKRSDRLNKRRFIIYKMRSVRLFEGHSRLNTSWSPAPTPPRTASAPSFHGVPVRLTR